MFFSKISLRQDAQSLQKLNQFVHKNGYYYHQLIWRLFSNSNPDKKRDFIYRAQFNKGWPTFYAISAIEPVDLENIWAIETKKYQPILQESDTLYFRVQVNPRICRKDKDGKASYFDCIQDAFHKNTMKEESKAQMIQDAGEHWLMKRSEQHGFKIQSVIADNFQKHRFKKYKQNHSILFSTIDLTGVLQVTNVEKFLQVLMHGIGSAKGFGCGMFMVKR
jgi:CRISPR system Cascade subunit CasE